LFLHLFTAEQQIAFARLAMFMVHADGEVDERERVLLDELQQEMGLVELPPVPSTELVSKDIGIFDDAMSRRIFLLEMSSIVTADGERHEAELASIRSWAQHLGEDEALVERYLDISDRAHEVYREAHEAVFG
jgi:uncharacterized tellurite resistance protein B-like protein